jgi:hypothetical protein
MMPVKRSSEPNIARCSITGVDGEVEVLAH